MDIMTTLTNLPQKAPPPRLWTDRATAGPAQQAGGGRKRHNDRPGTAQSLELPAGPLRRRHAQGLIPGGHLRRLAPVGTPSDPAPPLDGPKEGFQERAPEN
jgi:hypothetical protein